MKKLLLTLILLPLPVLASPKPFRYETPCFLETDNGFLEDKCVVIETRNKGGFLRSRNVFSNRFGLTVKGRFDENQNYITWDSHNNFDYQWDYKVGNVTGKKEVMTLIMPGFLLENVSWD